MKAIHFLINGVSDKSIMSCSSVFFNLWPNALLIGLSFDHVFSDLNWISAMVKIRDPRTLTMPLRSTLWLGLLLSYKLNMLDGFEHSLPIVRRIWAWPWRLSFVEQVHSFSLKCQIEDNCWKLLKDEMLLHWYSLGEWLWKRDLFFSNGFLHEGEHMTWVIWVHWGHLLHIFRGFYRFLSMTL